MTENMKINSGKISTPYPTLLVTMADGKIAHKKDAIRAIPFLSKSFC
jgi:hypothetical protein